MANYQLGPVIGKIGGGRESQEITITTSDQTITLGEGRWLLTCTANSFHLDGTFINNWHRIVEGPGTRRVRSFTGTQTLWITPLTD